MKILYGNEQLDNDIRCAVAIGKFDGIHKGHMEILKQLVQLKSDGIKTLVFTFNPSPSVFFKMTDGKMLSTCEEKRYLFEKMGIDYLVEFPFNKETASMMPEVFVKQILIDRFHASHIVAGEDISFGNRGMGNSKLLKTLAEECDFQLHLISKIKIDNTEVSSTLIRNLVRNNEIAKVPQYMGHGYSLSGIIVKGRRIGNTIGFPTINIMPGEDKLLPSYGVYYSRTYIKDKCYRSLSNLGVKPTVGQNMQVGLETYIYDFDEDVYGEYATVELLEFKRSEMKFDSLDDLKAAIAKDRIDGLRYE